MKPSTNQTNHVTKLSAYPTKLTKSHKTKLINLSDNVDPYGYYNKLSK